MADKYLVMYGKMADDKETGILLTGVYFGGVADTQEEADTIATKCVSESSSGMIIPKIAKMHTSNLVEIVNELSTQFQKMANSMYQNEKMLKVKRVKKVKKKFYGGA